MFCECYGTNFIITMPPRTQYLPKAGISQTDGERTAREARMPASLVKTEKKTRIQDCSKSSKIKYKTLFYSRFYCTQEGQLSSKDRKIVVVKEN